MNIDFEKVILALKQVNYKGYLTLEADTYLNVYTKENISDGIDNLAKAARKLADMYEGK